MPSGRLPANTYVGDYQLQTIIGKGGFGVVFKAFNPTTGVTVAVKRALTTSVAEADIKAIELEIQLLNNLSHENIVKYIDCVKQDGNLHIILEYAEAGTLSNLFKDTTLSEKLIVNYTRQVLQGLEYLHNQGVIHRDIKSSNILSTKDGVIKLSDFGVATKEAGKLHSVVGTPYWMAPEVIEMDERSPACDIWSLGCLVLELQTKNPPYFDLNPMAAMYRIVQDDHPPLPPDISPRMQDFLTHCFRKNPQMRPDARSLLKHKWITQYDGSIVATTSGLESKTSTINTQRSKVRLSRQIQIILDSLDLTVPPEDIETKCMMLSELQKLHPHETRSELLKQGMLPLVNMFDSSLLDDNPNVLLILFPIVGKLFSGTEKEKNETTEDDERIELIKKITDSMCSLGVLPKIIKLMGDCRRTQEMKDKEMKRHQSKNSGTMTKEREKMSTLGRKEMRIMVKSQLREILRHFIFGAADIRCQFVACGGVALLIAMVKSYIQDIRNMKTLMFGIDGLYIILNNCRYKSTQKDILMGMVVNDDKLLQTLLSILQFLNKPKTNSIKPKTNENIDSKQAQIVKGNSVPLSQGEQDRITCMKKITAIIKHFASVGVNTNSMHDLIKYRFAKKKVMSGIIGLLVSLPEQSQANLMSTVRTLVCHGPSLAILETKMSIPHNCISQSFSTLLNESKPWEIQYGSLECIFYLTQIQIERQIQFTHSRGMPYLINLIQLLRKHEGNTTKDDNPMMQSKQMCFALLFRVANASQKSRMQMAQHNALNLMGELLVEPEQGLHAVRCLSNWLLDAQRPVEKVLCQNIDKLVFLFKSINDDKFDNLMISIERIVAFSPLTGKALGDNEVFLQVMKQQLEIQEVEEKQHRTGGRIALMKVLIQIVKQHETPLQMIEEQNLMPLLEKLRKDPGILVKSLAIYLIDRCADLSRQSAEEEKLPEKLELRENTSTWVNDKDVTHCKECNKAFSLTRRKHHCRSCGQVICHPCSPNTIFFPDPKSDGNGGTQERVCLTCHKENNESPSPGQSPKPSVRPLNKQRKNY